ncbi:hypothetical protein JTB14_020356 [Gonioctena quinquepunctata]|nr:hypothetical protein JTB14_020356 [Gonioctena quinquepunctata]
MFQITFWKHAQLYFPCFQCFVHVSTAYSNFPQRIIEEKVYDFPIPLEDMKSIIENLKDEDVSERTPSIINPWPNTYTFTKALTESMIKSISEDLPITIFRPSVVMSTHSDPVAGWSDNLNGPCGICLGIISGVLKVMPSDYSDSTANLVPVDMCVAGMIAAAWDVAENEKLRTPENIPVYNYACDANTKPCGWLELMKISARHGRNYQKNPSNIFILYTRIFILNWVLTMLFHTIPAFMIDTVSSLRGKKARLSRMHKNLQKAFVLLSPFYTNSWTFIDDNIVQLWKKMDQTDKELFPLSLERVDWNAYFVDFIRGLREQYPFEPSVSFSGFSFFFNFLKTSLVFFACTTVASAIANYYRIIS